MNSRNKFKKYIREQRLLLAWGEGKYDIIKLLHYPPDRMPELIHICQIDKKLADHHFGGEVEAEFKAELSVARMLAELP